MRMNYTVEILTGPDAAAWDAYVHQHRHGSYCHLSGWKTVVERAYGRPTYFWVCREPGGRLAGILPAVHLKHLLFGNSLVSMPYLDGGGILADTSEAAHTLLSAARELAAAQGIPLIELRHFHADQAQDEAQVERVASDKVQMLIPLPDNYELLFKSFQNKNKVRTVIRKAEKLGLGVVWGGEDKLADFYEIFAANMRDLGTPVHSRAFFEWVWRVFNPYCQVAIVYLESQPIAAGIIFCHRDTVSFPFGGSLRSHNHLNPFPLLVWGFLKYACEHGFRFFDFGRSSVDSGPYKFKERWGAQPHPLHWQYARLTPGNTIMESRGKFAFFSHIWQKLPLTLTNVVGPPLRKYISL
jgi:serine/alanine adding enzyme